MRYFFLFLLPCFLFNPCFAQQLDESDQACREKCSLGHLNSRQAQVLYYQYPSMDKYDIKYLKLDLKAEAGSYFISGTAKTIAIALQPLDSFIIELKNNMLVDSVYINGTKKNFQHASDFIYVPLSPSLPAGTTVTALIYYNGTTGTAGVFAGTIASSGLTYTATLSESYQAREWFPAKQVLKDKIDSADIWVTTSAANKVGSNGILVAVVDSPNSKKQYQWKSRHPMNYYMPSIAVGNYREYTIYSKPAAMAPDSIPVLNYIANNESYFQSIKANLDKTPAFIEKFSELFGLYPFKNEKYGHSQANIGGGMEHQTMTTTSSFSSTIIAHELGHQWWGDRVTCATWNHIWLNEGFASYCEYLAIEKLPLLFSPTTAASYMQSVHTDVLSSTTGSVYVPDASIYDENRIFSTRFSYNKGSAIIHNLRFEMQSDTLFFQTLKNYQIQYKDSVATANDFKTVAENTCGRSFTDFFNQWYYGEGYPTIGVTYGKQGTDSIVLILSETVSAPTITSFFKGLYEIKITSAQGDTTVKVNLSYNNQPFKFYYTKTPTGIVVDPNNWVLNNTGTITVGSPGFSFDNPASTSVACGGPASASITLGTISNFGYSSAINLTASGVPAGGTITFSVNPVIPGNSTVVTLNNTNTLSAGTYDITITGVSGTITQTRVITFIIQSGTGPSITGQPVNSTVCAGSNATFSVTTSGTVSSYQWQQSTDGGNSFSNVSGGGSSASYTVINTIVSQNNYRFRVIVSGQCVTVTSNQVILTVNASPAVPAITPSTASVCTGNSQALTASGGMTGGTANATLGTATTLTTATTQPTAFCNRWAQYWNQTVYTVAELQAAGLTTGSNISSITYNITTLGDASNNTNFSIRIGNTANSVLSAFITTGLSTVYGPATYTHAIGLNTITFSTPYTWNGTSNIVIDVRQDGIDALNNSITYYTAASSNMNIEAHTSTTSSTTALQTLVSNSTVTPTASTKRLNIILGYSSLQSPSWSWSPSTGLNTTSGAVVVATPLASTTYTATATNSFGCTNSSTATVNIYPVTPVIFSGLATTYCTTNAAVVLTGSPSGGTFSGPGVSGNTFNPAVAGAGTFTITYSYTNANGCTNTATQQVTVNICNTLTALNLTLFFEGAYQGGGLMRATLFDLGLHADPTATDSITVNLWAVNDLTNSTPTYSVRALIHTNGTATMNFPSMVNGNSFYIAVRQRNHMEIWSKMPVLFSTTTSYDFSTGLIMAYDDGVNPPMQQMGTVYALWAGEISGDGAIDGTDMNEIDNLNGAFSYDISDVNGDGSTDGQDMNYVDNNALQGLFIARP